MDKYLKALVLFSGGQDSTTCLYWAITKFGKDNVQVLNISYLQRHIIEVECAEKIAKLAGIPYTIFNTDIFSNISDSALIGSGNIQENHRSSEDLPASFVPGRNLLFLTIAAAFAYKNEITNIITGVCQTDFSGYPDCRENTIKSLETTLSLGIGSSFHIHTPLMHLTKKETVEMALQWPECINALAYSHTCYEGKQPPCGKCPACTLREKGFKQAGINDPLIERLNNEK